MLDRPTQPSDDTEEKTAGMGHNNPPAFDPDVLAEHQKTVADFMAATKQWLDLEKISSQHQAEQLADQITGLRGLWKKVDEARTAAKKPHDKAGQEVQDAFNPILAKLKKAADSLKVKQGEYATANAERERLAKAKAADEAKRVQEAADERARLAAMDNDIDAQVEAEAAQRAAAAQAKAAAKAPETSIRSASGGGRTMSMRTIKDVEITNINVLFLRYRNHPDVAETLRRIATADVRAKGYDHDANPVPGIAISERKVMA